MVLFLMIFLYPLRKRVKWLGRIGSARHWLDFHVIAGLTAPVLIAFHASFKFRGIAGVAFWIMLSVAISGVIGRYIYAQIPRSLSSAELSLRELAEIEEALSKDLSAQSVFSVQDFAPLLFVPTSEQVREMPLYGAILQMITLDVSRPFHVARLRIRVLGWAAALLYLGGLIARRIRSWSGPFRSHAIKAALSKTDRVPVALATGVSSVARHSSSLQLLVCGAGADSHRGGYLAGIRVTDGDPVHISARRG